MANQRGSCGGLSAIRVSLGWRGGGMDGAPPSSGAGGGGLFGGPVVVHVRRAARGAAVSAGPPRVGRPDYHRDSALARRSRRRPVPRIHCRGEGWTGRLVDAGGRVGAAAAARAGRRRGPRTQPADRAPARPARPAARGTTRPGQPAARTAGRTGQWRAVPRQWLLVPVRAGCAGGVPVPRPGRGCGRAGHRRRLLQATGSERQPGVPGDTHIHCEWGGFAPIISMWQCWRVFPGQPDHPALPDPDIIPDGFGVPWPLTGPAPEDQWPPPGLAPAGQVPPPPP